MAFSRRLSFALSLTFLPATVLCAANGPAVRIPLAMHTLKNGLKIVVSEDHSAPIFGACVAYGVGFRIEPEGRTGFAHLFEHMMFEGTPDVPKGVFNSVIEGAGRSAPIRAMTAHNLWRLFRSPRLMMCFGWKQTG